MATEMDGLAVYGSTREKLSDNGHQNQVAVTANKAQNAQDYVFYSLVLGFDFWVTTPDVSLRLSSGEIIFFCFSFPSQVKWV